MKMYKKLFSALLILVMLFSFNQFGFAATGDSNFTNVVASGDVSGATGTYSGALTFGASLLANGRVGGASSISSSSTFLSTGAYPFSIVAKRVGVSGSIDNSANGSELHNGAFNGQTISFIITALVSGGSWILTPDTSYGFSKVTFDTAGDIMTLMYVNSTVGWIIVSNGGVVITIK